MTRARPELLLPLTALLLGVTQTRSFGVVSHSSKVFPHTLWNVRGGSLHINADEDEDDDDDEIADDSTVEMDEGDEDDIELEAEVEGEEENEDPISTVISSEPVSILFKTNVGSPLIDTSLELLVSRSRTIESVKNTLSRMLPGRPPVEVLRILLGNQELSNDQLVDEVVEDEDEPEDEDEAVVTLILDIIPPVDPKFATHLSLADLSTSELLDAYAVNAAAMYSNSQLFLEPREANDSSRLELLHRANRIREQMTTTWSEPVLQLLEMDAPSTQTALDDRRGQRVRSGGASATNLKLSLQRNLNVNWPETIRNFLLFLFFGIFGSRSNMSRNLLLMGAPLTFLLQVRPVKILLKQAFYAAANPPGILLSLLPAPQQVILSFDPDKARQTLFGENKDEKVEAHLDNDGDDNNDDDNDDDDDIE